MKTVDVSELRDNAHALIRRVSDGEEIAITQDDKPFARLVPVKQEGTGSHQPAEASSRSLSK
jgi:prevent-host-death family protein